MKIVAVVDKDLADGRALVCIDHTGTVPLEGQPPRPGVLELDCPGLDAPTRAALLRWLARNGSRVDRGRATGASAAGALDAVPTRAWRRVTYDEAMELQNFESIAYLVAAAAPLAEISACLARRTPPLLARIDAALAREEPEQLDGLAKTSEARRRVGAAVWGLTMRAEAHIAEVAERVDRDALAALRARPFDVATWVDAASRMKAPAARVSALIELVRKIPAGDGAHAHARAIVDAIEAHPTLQHAVRWAPTFWAAIAPLLDWGATLRGATVSLADATESVATPSWDLYRARRVGRIKIGRKVLVDAKTSTYIRGTRALLTKVIDAGGRLRHHGVTLTYPSQARPLTPRLVEVERIETLAYLDPLAALAVLGDRGRAPALRALAERARDDRGVARLLSDYLIEHALGIDADVARKLARASR